jgi:hypothetical protein
LRIEHHLFQRIGVWALPSVEIVILSVLILAARCVNYQDVFVSGNVYFTDADCYARMTRVRMCEKNPGLIIRHQDFENYPQGIASHTTAPLDYAIFALAVMLKPFTSQPLDLAGAVISPLFGLLAGWFLWWWSRQMQFPFRACMLTLYALSLILVHGTELGRPDHQSLLIMLVLIAIAAEWRLQTEESRIWGAISGAAWGLAFWVSLYEPLILLLIVIGLGVLRDRHFFQAHHRRTGWILFTLVVALAVAIERHVLSLPFTQGEDYLRWSRTIGELMSVSPTNSIWFQWVGWLLIAAPLLIWLTLRRKTTADGPTRRPIPSLVLGLLGTTYLLTLWQTRWAYFFAAIFCLTIPTLLASISRRWIGWIIFAVGLFPILQAWDQQLFPNNPEMAARSEQRLEKVEWRQAAAQLPSNRIEPLLAPWWLSPSAVYWSGQPGVAGSSHESLSGIADTAHFFLATDPGSALQILRQRKVAWVFSYDADRVAANSAAILGISAPAHPLCAILDRTPSQAPPFLVLAQQNGTCKLFRVRDSGEK